MLRSLRRPLRVGSAVAAAAAAAAASAAATSAAIRVKAACEPATTVPPFVLGAARYDQTTFDGRLQHIMELIDPLTLFTSDEELAEAQGLLAAYKAGGKIPPGADDEKMWHAQRIVGAIIHEPTGEKQRHTQHTPTPCTFPSVHC